jgi:uncharacterized protein YdhG (YjbR/CyaY superfamily)
MNAPGSVDEYIASFPVSIQTILREIRSGIAGTIPEATELMSYGMPTYKLNGKPVVYFGHAEFESELSKYKRGKGSVQFPINQPIPIDLMQRIARYRAANITKGAK